MHLAVGAGEIVSILGRNGVGRSTTLKAIMGDVPPHGSIVFKGEPIAGLKPYEIAHRGLGYVPEDRAVFPTLTVEHNLLLGVKNANKTPRWGFGDTYRVFPRLKERAPTMAGVLSGGEQQMLTICRTMMGDPDLIMIDIAAEHRRAQRLDPAGRAEAHDRHADLAPGLRHGSRPHRVRRHPRRSQGERGRAQGMAGGVRGAHSLIFVRGSEVRF